MVKNWNNSFICEYIPSFVHAKIFQRYKTIFGIVLCYIREIYCLLISKQVMDAHIRPILTMAFTTCRQKYWLDNCLVSLKLSVLLTYSLKVTSLWSYVQIYLFNFWKPRKGLFLHRFMSHSQWRHLIQAEIQYSAPFGILDLFLLLLNTLDLRPLRHEWQGTKLAPLPKYMSWCSQGFSDNSPTVIWVRKGLLR